MCTGGHAADNAPYADLRLWADVHTAGQPEPKRTLFLHQIKAEGTEGASNVQTLLDTFDTVKASIDRWVAALDYLLVCFLMPTM